jgi:Gluconate 2-dehydrogenase subunit 3
MDDPSRRDAIKIAVAATVAASAGGPESLVAQAAFFTKEELALIDELSEIIIPADEHSPGARAARVAAYLDRRLAQDWEQSVRTVWRDGLAVVERLSREMHGKSFLDSSMPERVAVLTRMAQNEAKPQRPEEMFFAELKSKVVHAYYTSEIGIKQEMEYKGNTYLTEFVGYL